MAQMKNSTKPFSSRLSVVYANAFSMDPSATPDDLREAVTTLEDAARTGRRVFGAAHPVVSVGVMEPLRIARAALRAREKA